MGVIEGFATIILENEQEVQKRHNTYLFQLYLIIIALRLFFVFVVWKFLWSQIMPKISSSIKAKPSFMSLLGLSVIYSLLF